MDVYQFLHKDHNLTAVVAKKVGGCGNEVKELAKNPNDLALIRSAMLRDPLYR